MRASRPANASALTRLCAMSRAVLVERAREVAHDPVGRELGLAAELAHDGLVVAREFAARRQHAGVVLGEAVIAHEPRRLFVRQLGHRGPHLLDRRFVDHERQQVGVREVAVVVRLFLRAHRARLALVGIVQARFLLDLAAALEQLDLALDFVIDGALDEAERVDVLDLGAGAELGLADRAHGDVRVAAERAFLHVAVADLEVAHQRVDLLQVRDRLPWPSACRARTRSRAAACRRGSGRCPTARGSPRAATCPRLPRGARA